MNATRIARLRLLFWLGLLLAMASLPFALLVQATSPSQNLLRTVPLMLGWTSSEVGNTRAVAWGDYDGDGDLDLVTGDNETGTLSFYRTTAGVVGTSAVATLAGVGDVRALAWGDLDVDGDLDLVVAAYAQPSRLFANDGGTFAPTPAWSSAESATSTSLALADYDRDGDLDLALGNDGQSNRLYHNDNGTLTTSYVWAAAAAEPTTSLAWGDADGDGDLDLAVGNNQRPVRVYRNDDGVLTVDPVWSSAVGAFVIDQVISIAWGDLDGDNDLDLVTGSGSATAQVERVYRNESSGTTIDLRPIWSSSELDITAAVALGDYDSDGDLDLAVGNRGTVQSNGEVVRLYRNDSSPLTLTLTLAWESPQADTTLGVAWGDYDDDGDLDLAVGNVGPNRIYRNDGSPLPRAATWSSALINGRNPDAVAMAWGDYDDDGDLDLAVGVSRGASLLYRNDGDALSALPSWLAPTSERTTDLAWGDYDGDGDLDLALSNAFSPSQLYRNQQGTLSDTPIWTTSEALDAQSLAWGDVDGDGDLDLAIAALGAPVALYRNNGVTLDPSPDWRSAAILNASDLAWGDFDNDGDLDLAVATAGQSQLYRNDRGSLAVEASWMTADTVAATSLAWGDLDGDGDLDLALASRSRLRLYRNNNGTLSDLPAWRSTEADNVQDLAWADYDSDGDLDLAAANGNFQPNRLYRNDGGSLSLSAAWSSVEAFTTNALAWGDVDGDGDLDLAAANWGEPVQIYRNRRELSDSPAPGHQLRIRPASLAARANFYAAGVVLSGTISLSYTLSHPRSLPVRAISGQFSINGGDSWLPAVALSTTQTSDLATSLQGRAYTYYWDVPNSGLMGQSDNLVFRLIAWPDLRPEHGRVAGPFLFGASTVSTFPFRVRGSQVRVLSDNQPVAGALVYRQSRGQFRATAFADRAGIPFRTDGQGYLQGRGIIARGDRIAALLPMQATESYTLYHTSAAPTTEGLDLAVVDDLGVQTLRVSPRHPLLLLNLEIALEWDARRDRQFMEQLALDLRRTSELLYDWTDGQVALGQLTVHHDRGRWEHAHVHIFATNRLRPNANQGGILLQDRVDPNNAAITYVPGQVRIGAVWNRYGESSGNLAEDWPRTLAHELGHFALFLDDNYIGLDRDGRLVAVNSCPSAMSDPYRDDYSEFHPQEGWLAKCGQTLSNQSTGRSDWSTITAFYPALQQPRRFAASDLRRQSAVVPPASIAASWQVARNQLRLPLVVNLALAEPNSGPATLPLGVTQIAETLIVTAPETLELSVFSLVQNGIPAQPGTSARAFLFRREGDRLIDLGRPTLDQVTARGARPGDRLCVYDLGANRLGCLEAISPTDERLTLQTKPGWQPDVQVTPITSRTVDLRVANVPSGLALKARIFPVDQAAPAAQALTAGDPAYSTRFDLAQPVLDGYVQIWVEEDGKPRREIVVDYALGGNPGRIRTRNAPRGNPGRIRTRNAPAVSADGQVILYGADLQFPEGSFYTVQAASVMPPPIPHKLST